MSSISRFFLVAVAVVLLGSLAASGGAWAQKTVAGQLLYGSFYYNETTGSYGNSYNYNTEREAEDRAFSECSAFGSGCVKIVNYQKCAAFAEWRRDDDTYVYGYSYNYDTLLQALDAAMDECVKRNDGYKCGIIMYACNEN